jgi:putative heme-binding domain-containing protein
MRLRWIPILFWTTLVHAEGPDRPKLPEVPAGWSVELVVQAPEILYPTAIVAAPDGTIYLGQDPMDMPGPPTEPIDSIVAIRGGKVSVFADKLWSVMGLEWIDDTLYVVHAPFLSAFRDTDGDGKADWRQDLMTGLGPKLPGFNGINDHVPSGLRLGLDGYLYISVGDKGIPKGVGKDGATIRLFGGGVIRIRPDGTGLEVVSSGERNPLSVALSATGEIFTYGNDDDSKRWPNSLTHHIVGGRYGYPYEFTDKRHLILPIMSGQLGGSGAQGTCYDEDGLPESYRGNLFFCDWGLQRIDRFEIKKAGGTHTVVRRTPFMSKGDVPNFRPFSITVDADRSSLLVVDWAYDSWLASAPRTGRLYRVRYNGSDRITPTARPSLDRLGWQIEALDHPALSIRLEAQRALIRQGPSAIESVRNRLSRAEPETGRLHALWVLDGIGTEPCRSAIRVALADASRRVRFQAARSAGIRKDKAASDGLIRLLDDRDPAVRREAAIALGRLGGREAAPALMAHLGDSDKFAAWSVREAIRKVGAWDRPALVAALLDDRRRESTLILCENSWELPVVEALTEVYGRLESPLARSRVVSILAGLYRRYPEWSGNWFGTNPLAGQFPQKTVDWKPEGMSAVVRGLVKALADRDREVRLQAIVGLGLVGAKGAPILRAALLAEPDPGDQAAIIRALGALDDAPSVPSLATLLNAPGRSPKVQAAALDALARFRGPQSLGARFAFLYGPQSPPDLIARALGPLSREGALPPNDVAGFLNHAQPAVRAAALMSLNIKKTLPADIKTMVLDRLADTDPDVRKAAALAVVPLRIQEAVPKLIAIAQREGVRDEDRLGAVAALCGLPDVRALPIYLAALSHRDPQVRRNAESALASIRARVRGELETAIRSGTYSGPAGLALERLLADFRPLVDWKVIGPFPRTTAQVFLGERSIDFGRSHAGAEGRVISWTEKKGDPRTGQVRINEFKGGAGDRGGFGYDSNGSPDLAAFGYTEVESDDDRSAMLFAGSSGTLIVTVNEKPVFQYVNFAGRPYQPESDLIPISLRKGSNRILVMSRQGIGPWSFGLQVSAPSDLVVVNKSGTSTSEQLKRFALGHDGRADKGEAIFFDPKGVGCVKCHSVVGRGGATIGPDLAGLALKYDKAEVIRSVLDPSNRIATGYQPVIVATLDGKVYSGLVRSDTDEALELVDADAKSSRIPKSEIDERRVGNISVMPTRLVEGLSPAEFSDLIAYLMSLRKVDPGATASTRPGASRSDGR